MSNRIKNLLRDPNSKATQYLIHERGKWLDYWAKKLLPAELYAKAESASGGERKEIMRWFGEHNIAFAEGPDKAVIMETQLEGEPKILGEFRIVAVAGRLTSVSVDLTLKKN